MEPELHGDPRLAGDVADRVLARGVPVQDGVAIVEEVGTHHERLGAAAFLGRASVEPQRAFERPGADLLRQGQARRGRGDPEEVVAATVAGRDSGPCLPDRYRLLRETGQGVVLAEDADHRAARADGGEERRRDAGDPSLDPEAARLQSVGQQRRRPLLLVADLGPVPDLFCHRPRPIGVLLDERVDRRLAGRWLGVWPSGTRLQAEIPRDATTLSQVELLARFEEIIPLAIVILAVVDGDDGFADDQEPIAVDDDGGRLVEPQAEQAGLGLDDADQVLLSAAGQQMLVDGHAAEISESVLVALGHHGLVTLARAPDEVRALDGRPGRRAADHPSARQDVLDLALGTRAHVGIDQPPLPAAAEPDAPRRLQRGDERLRVGLGPVARVQHGHVRHAELLRRMRSRTAFQVLRPDLVGRRDQHERGVGAAREVHERPERRRILAPAVDHERPGIRPDHRPPGRPVQAPSGTRSWPPSWKSPDRLDCKLRIGRLTAGRGGHRRRRTGLASRPCGP